MLTSGSRRRRPPSFPALQRHCASCAPARRCASWRMWPATWARRSSRARWRQPALWGRGRARFRGTACCAAAPCRARTASCGSWSRGCTSTRRPARWGAGRPWAAQALGRPPLMCAACAGGWAAALPAAPHAGVRARQAARHGHAAQAERAGGRQPGGCVPDLSVVVASGQTLA